MFLRCFGPFSPGISARTQIQQFEIRQPNAKFKQACRLFPGSGYPGPGEQHTGNKPNEGWLGGTRWRGVAHASPARFRTCVVLSCGGRGGAPLSQAKVPATWVCTCRLTGHSSAREAGWLQAAWRTISPSHPAMLASLLTCIWLFAASSSKCLSSSLVSMQHREISRTMQRAKLIEQYI